MSKKIENGNTEQALKVLLASSLNSDDSVAIQVINSDFKRNEKLYSQKLITDADFRVIINKINHSILILLNAKDGDILDSRPKRKRKMIVIIASLIVGALSVIGLSINYVGESEGDFPNISLPPSLHLASKLTEDTFEARLTYFEEKIRLSLDKNAHIRGGSEILSAKIDTYEFKNNAVYAEGRFDAKNFLLTYQGGFTCEIQIDGNHSLESLEFNNPIDREWTPVGNKILEEVNGE